MRMLRAHLGAYAGSSPGAASAGYFPLGGTMPKLAVLLIVLLCSIGAMSAYGSGAKDQIDPALTDDVEALLEQSLLREFAGLEPTPILATPLSHVGPAFVEIPLIIDDGHVPLSDLDALYGVDGAPRGGAAGAGARCAACRPGRRHAGDDRQRVGQPAFGHQVAMAEVLIGAAALAAAALVVWTVARCALRPFLRAPGAGDDADDDK